MKVSKILINFPEPIGSQMKDFLISKGFTKSKFVNRGWEADLTDIALEFAIKMNENYASEPLALIKFYQPVAVAPEVMSYIKKKGFVFCWTDKQWHGLKSALNAAITDDILKVGSINYID